MKGIKRRIFIGILILFAALSIMFFIRANTIEDALNESNQKSFIILHTKETHSGSMVFYTHENADDLSISVVTKSIGRNKVIYSGTQGELQQTLDKKGMSYGFLPGINELSFPIYYGAIGNSAIDQVKIIERKSGLSLQAKIIDAGKIRLWYVDMSEFKGENFEIIGSDADGKSMVSIEDSLEFLTLKLKP